MTASMDVVIDTDAFNEIDDQFAVAHAWLTPELDVQALYAAPFLNSRSQSAGDGMEQSFDELGRLTEMLPSAPQTRVLRGSTRFMTQDSVAEESEAVRDLINRALAHEADRPLHVIAIGAPTNVANALVIEPAIAERIRLTWLGGHAFHWPTTDEFNMRQDPSASRAVLATQAPLTLVPCFGVASELVTTLPELSAWLEPSPLSNFLMKRFEDTQPSMFAYGRALWDVAATAVLACPSGIEADMLPVPTLREDLVWGPPGGRIAHVVRRVHRNRVMADLLQKLNSLAGSDGEADQ